MQRDHGGNLDWAQAHWGGDDWIDLSTGINRRPWVPGVLSTEAFRALPTGTAESRLISVAAEWFGCPADMVLPMAGASAPIQALPRILTPGHAAVLAPSYNEHAASLKAAGWRVTDAPTLARMEGADLAVVVNPNNPDGREFPPATLRALAARTGRLIVDESFADPRPDLSLAHDLPANAVVLRSFGKFWGLAGLRLGFVIAAPALLARLREFSGPWSVSGPALEIATLAMADREWAADTVTYHAEAANRLDMLAMGAGWSVAGGTHLFRLFDTPDAAAAQNALARHRIWSRRFPYSDRWLRLGLPGTRAEWDRVATALAAIRGVAP
ncbi:threonine-phosphate decarboxylase CobD [Paracoccus sp. 1_MG-2023]|uniref:threonine-phosphate decarboxylase CobD n=1 Tax=unclassified Paracoccus (in: a-proteobacteria) TaxID=2688777 RepID=UPI001C09B754|nr:MULTISPECIES: threonine-phosphate decarboxylase CobD [unclassified Paracoccus (in: a-proteobacteria)]MBU2958133.1 threonine-phosphate decarboxylase CobD [Paracoccus sp. C2R09]MDO6669281.1 threonine-phosphate decarboxylase CobD [Paracoccus sp. 1_MG-2023]